MGEKQKILLCGDVEGKFDNLFTRVTTINKKTGPFDCLFCVGNFFGVNNQEFEPYKNGVKKVPIPTYILGPNKVEHVDLYPEDETELCTNLYCLGKRGIFTTTKGLKVAYVSGIASEDSSQFEYSPKDITEIFNACVKGNSNFRGIDLLLSSQWPNGIREDANEGPLSSNTTTDLLSWLILKLKARYHVFGLKGIYYERAPFRCPLLNEHDSTLEIATRCIGLARVGNVEKAKWLYALSLTPLDQMKIGELLQKTTDETECPFNFDDLEHKIFKIKRKSNVQNQYFYNTNVEDDEKVHRKKHKRQKMEFDQSKCWFCLASSNVEKHLILSIGDFTYLTLAKGGLVDDHLLICPIEHFQHNLGLSDDAYNEINQFKEALRKWFLSLNKTAVFFERNYKTSHMQLQVVPIPEAKAKNLQEIFQEKGECYGLNLQILEKGVRLSQVLESNIPYFTVELPDKTILYSKIKGEFPLNFAREVLADQSVLNLHEKIDWKDCILPKDKEESLVKDLQKKFSPFDFTQ